MEIGDKVYIRKTHAPDMVVENIREEGGLTLVTLIYVDRGHRLNRFTLDARLVGQHIPPTGPKPAFPVSGNTYGDT